MQVVVCNKYKAEKNIKQLWPWDEGHMGYYGSEGVILPEAAGKVPNDMYLRCLYLFVDHKKVKTMYKTHNKRKTECLFVLNDPSVRRDILQCAEVCKHLS